MLVISLALFLTWLVGLISRCFCQFSFGSLCVCLSPGLCSKFFTFLLLVVTGQGLKKIVEEQ